MIMMMRILRPIGQGLWAPSSGVRDVFSLVLMMMIIRPIGQLGLWAPSSGARAVFTSTAYAFTYPPFRGL
jgi:hypothetical protein